jgi:hypothetical protein
MAYTSFVTAGQLACSSIGEIYSDTDQIFVEAKPSYWIETIFGMTPQMDNIRENYANLIANKQFEKAVDFILNEVFEESKILALKTHIPVEEKTELAYFFEELKNNGIVSTDEWQRLTVLQMAIDGLDLEVYEYGASMNSIELDYLTEFLWIIRDILARNNMYIGVSSSIQISVCFSSFQSTNVVAAIATTKFYVTKSVCAFWSILTNCAINTSENTICTTNDNTAIITSYQADQ